VDNELPNDHINLNLGPEAKFTQRRHLMLLVLATLDKRSAEAIAKDKYGGSTKNVGASNCFRFLWWKTNGGAV